MTRMHFIAASRARVWRLTRRRAAPGARDIERGIEAWQKAFEKAGFRKRHSEGRALAFRRSRVDPEDALYSVVRWLPSSIENAQGLHVHDPRTAEIPGRSFRCTKR
jgi:hypothetical protein